MRFAKVANLWPVFTNLWLDVQITLTTCVAYISTKTNKIRHPCWTCTEQSGSIATEYSKNMVATMSDPQPPG